MKNFVSKITKFFEDSGTAGIYGDVNLPDLKSKELFTIMVNVYSEEEAERIVKILKQETSNTITCRVVKIPR